MTRPKNTRDPCTWMYPLEIIALLFLEFTTQDFYLPHTGFSEEGRGDGLVPFACRARRIYMGRPLGRDSKNRNPFVTLHMTR